MAQNPSVPNYIYVSVTNLRFDPENPRLPSTVDGANEAEVLKWMLADATLLELMGAIGEQGYFPGEPLLVVSDGNEQETFTVVEGNRRLAAVKLLNNPELAAVLPNAVHQISTLANEKPDVLPVIVYETRNEILDYLGYRHVTGVKPWGPLAKARYVAQMLARIGGNNLDEQHKSLARMIGSRASYVAQLLAALRLYERAATNNFFRIKDVNETTVSFSLLTTALGYNNIVEYLGLESNRDASLEGLNEEHLQKLFSWMFEKHGKQTRLGESRRLSDLSEIVASETALEAFERGAPLSEAKLLTTAPTAFFRKAIYNAKKQLQQAQNYSHLVDGLAPTDVDDLTSVSDLALQLRSFAEKQIASPLLSPSQYIR